MSVGKTRSQLEDENASLHSQLIEVRGHVRTTLTAIRSVREDNTRLQGEVESLSEDRAVLVETCRMTREKYEEGVKRWKYMEDLLRSQLEEQRHKNTDLKVNTIIML